MAISNSLDRLINNLGKHRGLAKPYDFRVDITHPRYFPQTLLDDFNTMLQDTTLPSKVYSKQPVYYGGPLENFPYVATYNGEISCTLILRKRDPVYNALHKWHQSIINSFDHIVSWPDDYMCKQAKIFLEYKVLEKNETIQPNITSEYTLYDLWPESITEIPLTQSSQNEYIRYTVTFCFRQWIKKDSEIGDPTSAGNAGSDFNPDFVR